MNNMMFRFEFDLVVDFDEAETTLQLAIMAAEGLVGEACVRMDVTFEVDPALRTIFIDGGSPTGEVVTRIFTSLLTHEFGADVFWVRRLPARVAHAIEVAA